MSLHIVSVVLIKQKSGSYYNIELSNSDYIEINNSGSVIYKKKTGNVWKTDYIGVADVKFFEDKIKQHFNVDFEYEDFQGVKRIIYKPKGLIKATDIIKLKEREEKGKGNGAMYGFKSNAYDLIIIDYDLPKQKRKIFYRWRKYMNFPKSTMSVIQLKYSDDNLYLAKEIKRFVESLGGKCNIYLAKRLV